MIIHGASSYYYFSSPPWLSPTSFFHPRVIFRHWRRHRYTTLILPPLVVVDVTVLILEFSQPEDPPHLVHVCIHTPLDLI